MEENQAGSDKKETERVTAHQFYSNTTVGDTFILLDHINKPNKPMMQHESHKNNHCNHHLIANTGCLPSFFFTQ